MPTPTSHACDLNPSGDFSDTYRRMSRKHDGKKYSVLMRRTKVGKMREWSYSYDKTVWDASDARAHCQEHDGKFAKATGG